MTLPAGLLDDRIEFFQDPSNQDVCYALTGGRVIRVKELPHWIKSLIWDNIYAHPKKLDAIKALGFTGDAAILEKYCSCVFGVFDGHADFADGRFSHEEYVPCLTRESCPANGVLCNPLTVGNGNALTHHQSIILRMVGRCLLNKEIAGHLGISEETVKIHVRNIQKKAAVMNKKDLVKLAHQKQLV